MPKSKDDRSLHSVIQSLLQYYATRQCNCVQLKALTLTIIVWMDRILGCSYSISLNPMFSWEFHSRSFR